MAFPPVSPPSIPPSDTDLAPTDEEMIKDTTSKQEQKSSYQFINSWGSEGIGDGEFNQAKGIDIDSSTGNVYVVDKGNNRYHKVLQILHLHYLQFPIL